MFFYNGDTSLEGEYIMIFWLCIIFIIILDRTSKNMAFRLLKKRKITFMNSKLQLFLVKNKGIAFNIFSGKLRFIIKITSIFLFVIMIYLNFLLQSPGETMFKIGLSFIIGGGASNLIDRFIYEYVLDFIYFNFKRFPIFNLADFFILGGSLILLVSSL